MMKAIKRNIFIIVALIVGAFLLFRNKADAALTDTSKNNINSIAADIIARLNLTKYYSNAQILNFIKKIITVESNYKNVVGRDGVSIGLMQVVLSTAQWMLNNNNLTKDDLLNINTNLEAGIKYFIYQLNRYSGSLEDAVVAYNLGSSPYKTPSAFAETGTAAATVKAQNYYEKFVNAEI